MHVQHVTPTMLFLRKYDLKSVFGSVFMCCLLFETRQLTSEPQHIMQQPKIDFIMYTNTGRMF